MATKHVLKFSAITDFFCDADEKRLISRGENAVESNHIKSFQFSAELLKIKGEVHASMRDRAYNVEVNLGVDGDIESASCTCPRGQYLCHHVAAICIYGHYNISVTDMECRWAARKRKEEDVKTIDEIYVSRSHRSTDRELNEEELANFKSEIQKFGTAERTAVGFSWLLRDEPAVGLVNIPDVEEFLFSEQYLDAEDKENCFLQTMKVTNEIMKQICLTSVGQTGNENWLTYRKNRSTASNFGVVLAAISRGRYPPSLYKRLTSSYNLQAIKAIQWGHMNEKLALEEFTAATNLEVVPTGLWLDPCGFLGGSPDGLVGHNAIIEVKCPYKYRDKFMMAELKLDHTYIVKVGEQDEVVLNKNHEYYHQIQGNLEMTGRSLCYLLIWTPKQSILQEVPKDTTWAVNLPLLKGFYLKEYLPYITGKVCFD